MIGRTEKLMDFVPKDSLPGRPLESPTRLEPVGPERTHE